MHNCYTTDWQRTEPDYVIYLPTMPGGRDEYADHIHVFYTPGGDMMCIWTKVRSKAQLTVVLFSRGALTEDTRGHRCKSWQIPWGRYFVRD